MKENLNFGVNEMISKGTAFFLVLLALGAGAFGGYQAGNTKGYKDGQVYQSWLEQQTSHSGSTANTSQSVAAPTVSTNKYVHSWVKRSGFGDSRVTINGDHTGSASGYIFGSGCTFIWHEEGDHIVIEKWSVKQSSNFTKGIVSPDGMNLNLTAPGTYENFEKDK